MNIKLSDATAAELAKRPVQYDTGFTLLPGKYKIKFLARDAETGRIGTYRDGFRDSQPEQGRQADCDQLGGFEQPARGHAEMRCTTRPKTKGKAESVNPLVQEGQKLIPSVTRVFSKGREMYVYLQAYQQSGKQRTPVGSVRDFLSRPGQGVRDAAAQVTERLNNRLKTTPLKFSLSLSKLPPGEYNCQVTILDPTGQKAAFWQAPVMLIP